MDSSLISFSHHALLPCNSVFYSLISSSLPAQVNTGYDFFLPYTTIPLNTTACVVHGEKCQAMQAITDSLQNSSVLGLSSQNCLLSVDCLVLRCNNSDGLATSLTLSPCDYSVKLRVFRSNDISYENKFIQSAIEPLYGTNEVLIDVTLARFKDGSSLGLQVCIGHQGHRLKKGGLHLNTETK